MFTWVVSRRVRFLLQPVVVDDVVGWVVGGAGCLRDCLLVDGRDAREVAAAIGTRFLRVLVFFHPKLDGIAKKDRSMLWQAARGSDGSKPQLSQNKKSGGAPNSFCCVLAATSIRARLGRPVGRGFLFALLAGIALLTAQAQAADITIIDATTGTNGSTTYPGNNNPLAQNQNLTVTATGSITTDGSDAIKGSFTGEGGNTITIEGGASVSNARRLISVFGSHNNSSVVGVDGAAANTVIVQAGATITSTSAMSSDVFGIAAQSNNNITNEGTINISGTPSAWLHIYGIYAINENNSVVNSGTITGSSNYLLGILAGTRNDINTSGTITTTGLSTRGISTNTSNKITVSGNVSTSGASSYGIFTEGQYNVSNISGTVSATGANSYAIASGLVNPTAYSNLFHLLGGASITGGIDNANVNGNGTSYLTFGYTKNGSNQAVLTTADNAFSFTYNSNITSASTGNWDGYVAGGTTTLNGTTNTFRNLYVGGDCFTPITLFAGQATQTNIVNIAGATATLNVTNAISTTGAFTVGTGSAYTLTGTHTHTGGNVSVLGTMNLNGGTFTNNATSGAQTITNLAVAATKTGTLSGTAATTVTNAPTISGTLLVNNGVTFTNGITSIASTGVLGGSGTITGDITTGGFGGMLSPGNSPGLLSVVGNVTLSGGDTLRLEVADSGYDRLAVTGDVTFDNGALITVLGSGGQANTTYEVVTATGTLTDNGANVTVTDTSALLNYTYEIIDGAAGKMTVTTSSSASAYESRASGGNMGLARTLDGIAANHPSSMDGMFNALNQLPDNASVNNAMTQLNNGNAAAASTQVGLASAQLSNRTLSSQFASFRQGNLVSSLPTLTAARAAARESVRAAAGGMPTDEESAKSARKKQLEADAASTGMRQWGGMLKFYGGFGQEGSSGSATGYDFGGTGVMTGLDYAFSQELRAGGLIDYSYNRANLYNSLGNVTDNVLRVGPYGSFNWDNLFFDTAPTMGIHMLETQRNIAFLNTTATGERTGCDFNWLNDVGYRFDLPKGIMLTPTYGLGFTTMYDPQYTETGAASGSNLKVNEFTNYSLLQNLELKVGRVFEINDCLALLPEVWGGWEHEYLSNAGDVTTAFAATPSQSWATPVSTIASDRAVFGLGLTTLITDRWSVFGRYDQKLWDGGYSTNFSAGIRIGF